MIPDKGLSFLQVSLRELDCPAHSLPEEDQRQRRRQQGGAEAVSAGEQGRSGVIGGAEAKGGVSKRAEAEAASGGLRPWAEVVQQETRREAP